jgi:hypothetical protein
MKEKLKAFALRIAFSRLGPTIVQLVSGAVGFLLGWIVNATSAIGFEMTASQQTEVSLAITACIYWIISQIINNYAGKYSEELQAILKNANPLLKVDRWIGPETIAAAQEAAQKAASNPSTGEIYEGKSVAPTLTEKATQAQAKLKPKPKRKPVIPYNPKR